jgi:ribonucleoside-diphosphate reductase beta chain
MDFKASDELNTDQVLESVSMTYPIVWAIYRAHDLNTPWSNDEVRQLMIAMQQPQEDEMILRDDMGRMTILPIEYPDVWRMYKIHEASIWHAHEVRLDKDMKDWDELSEDAKYFLKMILAFFASSDMIVSENLCVRFMKEIQMTEAQVFYGFQNMMENIHSETYSNMIDTYINDADAKTHLLNAVTTVPCIARKAAWARKWIEGGQTLGERMVAFALVEGVFFSGSFCSIYWMNEKGKLPGLAKGNDFIARDEAIHVAFAVLMYTKYIQNKMSNKRFAQIMSEAVELEIEFITVALPCRLVGMNSVLMIKYIKYCANRLAKQLGHTPIYEDIDQPFPFMERICLREKSNFFEDDASAYKKKGIGNTDGAYDDL